jgi:hypothetical protein
MTTLSPLQKTAAEFASWRSNKNGRGETTPTALRRKAIELTKKFAVSQVTQALRLSGSVIKRWREELVDNQVTCEKETRPFVSLPKAAAKTSCVQRITLSFDDGGTIELTGDISSRLALVITEAIWRENASGAIREVA